MIGRVLRSEANAYTLYGALFGCCFPVGSIAVLHFIGALGETEGGLVDWSGRRTKIRCST